MAQEHVWDNEYKKPQLLTKENKPQSDVVRFVQFLKKEQKINLDNKKVIDLGSGTGRNSFYFAELGCDVTGVEISKTAVELGDRNAREEGLDIKYIKQSIGDTLPLGDQTFDIALDVTSSNSLSEKERETFLSETSRILKPGAYFFTKALCKDGDENAKYLLKNSPGKEKDTYIMPDLKVEERVWTKKDFIDTYSKHFKILNVEKKTSYSRMNDRVYKRNFWIVYMQK
jgi:SAM-dependent methyltransferase